MFLSRLQRAILLIGTPMAQRLNVFTPLMTMKGRLWLQAGVIAAAILAIYAPVLHGDWIGDDKTDITTNAIIQSPTGLSDIWFKPGSLEDYYPIKASVQWGQWHLWHMDTVGYHFTNIFLHLINALLVWRFLGKFRLKFAWLGGLLFAIHPVNVESVAWIAELKNTLSLPFFLLAMIAWIDYDKDGKQRNYLLSVAFFFITMLCKTSAMMFPFVILLYAWWGRGEINRRDLYASVPFFVISLVLGLATLWSETWYLQVHHQEGHFVQLGWVSRFALAGLSLAFYLSKSICPVNLSFTYSRWIIEPPSVEQFLPWIIFCAAALWFWFERASWGKHALLGLGFFALQLTPVLGFVVASYMNVSWVMDHFLYLPIIGIIGLLMAGLEAIDKRALSRGHYYVMGVTAVIMGLLTVSSRAYAAIFTDPITLCASVIEHNPDSRFAHRELGSELLQRGRIDEAIEQYQKALEIDSDLDKSHGDLGLALSIKGRLDEAISQFQKALELNPHMADVRNNLGIALSRKGQWNEAITQFQEVLKTNPTIADTYNNLGIALSNQGQLDQAMEQYQKALQINPNDSKFHYNLGNTLFKKGLWDEAIIQFQQVMRLDPSNTTAQSNLTKAQAMSRQTPDSK
jgi:Tfp pilus assembly protein PilF